MSRHCAWWDWKSKTFSRASFWNIRRIHKEIQGFIWFTYAGWENFGGFMWIHFDSKTPSQQSIKDVWGFLQGHPVLVKWWLNYGGTVERGRFAFGVNVFHNVSRIFEGYSQGKSRAECLNSILHDKHLTPMVSNHDQICTEYTIWVSTGPKNSSPQRCANITGAFFVFQATPPPHEKHKKAPKINNP